MDEKNVLLAFSGGLDTTYCLVYLKEKGYNVHTLTVNSGSFNKDEESEIEKKAYKLGAVNHFAVDGKDILYTRWVGYLLKFGYLRGGTYPPCVGPEREVIVDQMTKFCKEHKINIVAHGSTGAGGDQVRFESALYIRMKDIKILAPIRDLRLSRQQEYEYLKSRGIDIDESTKKYSINKGMIGITIGGTETLDTKKPIPDSEFPNVLPIDLAGEAEEVKISFQDGLVIKVNDRDLSGPEVFEMLNKIGARNAYGKGYHIGRSIIGLKARIAFEAPAYKMLIECIKELQKVCLTSDQLFWIGVLGNVYGDMVHNGRYYSPIVNNLQSFIDSAIHNVSGDVVIILNKGSLMVKSINAETSLFNVGFGTYGETMSQQLTSEDLSSLCKMYEIESQNFNFINNETSN
jgi:argininosuccinate synthase